LIFCVDIVLQIAQDLHVRVTDLPISDRLRDLRQNHLNCLVRVSGVVTRRSAVFPQLKSAVYECTTCGISTEPFRDINTRPSICVHCQASTLRMNSSKSEYGNYQKITLQESPGSVPPGRVPRYKDVVLLGDLIDIARPGEEVEVTGIYSHHETSLPSKERSRGGFPVFSTMIEANSVVKKGTNSANSDISDEDKRNIIALSQESQVCILSLNST
jgi:DNA replication licensing factor MCM2